MIGATQAERMQAPLSLTDGAVTTRSAERGPFLWKLMTSAGRLP
jgi:hypothetical protein